MEQSQIRIADTRDDFDTEAKMRLLETFELKSVHRQMIHIHTKEFSAVCPGTGLPDIGLLDVKYIPNLLCVELKALKYYLFSYRDDAIFQEPVTDLIFDHLWRVLEPHYLYVRMQYHTRGGLDTVTYAEQGENVFSNYVMSGGATGL